MMSDNIGNGTSSSAHYAHGHLFGANSQTHLLLTNGSRIYRLTDELAEEMYDAIEARNSSAMERILSANALDAPAYIECEPPKAFSMRALSLAIAQKCNLGCTYCFAQGGDFGGPARNMPLDVAKRSIDRLLADVNSGDRVNLAFLGGEPLVNRAALIAACEYAAAAATAKDVSIGFSITTNGTLITPEDGAFFERYGFAVTISLDGLDDTHDALRPFKGGAGSYRRIIERVRPLLELQRRMQVSARVTVTPRNLDLPHTLDGLIDLGFHSVGFSPVLNSPTGQDEMDVPDLDVMLQQMIACGEECERRTIAGERYPFSNLLNAVQEIHKGTHRPYPCGAGAGYFGVSAEGGLFACHRFVNEERGRLGDVDGGVAADEQANWLAQRHVHSQEPCSGCWARYLCGGGCHHEVIHRGRPACDYIRGWLHYCLQAYVRVLEQRPDLFGESPARLDTGDGIT